MAGDLPQRAVAGDLPQKAVDQEPLELKLNITSVCPGGWGWVLGELDLFLESLCTFITYLLGVKTVFDLLSL